MIYANDDYRAAVACEEARLYEPEVWDEEPEDDEDYNERDLFFAMMAKELED